MEHWYTVIGTVEILRVYKSVVMGQNMMGAKKHCERTSEVWCSAV